jgi:VCBS repeat-containing protein
LLKNTIVANSPSGGNCNGTITDGGYNLDDGTSCGFSTADNSQPSTDPLLDPKGLQDNGGPTKTIALQPTSPAIDLGKSFGAPTDQRDQPRPHDLDDDQFPNATGGDGSDIGAFEVQPPEAKDDDATTDEDTPVSVNVLSNDTDPDTGDDLDIASFGQGQNGSVTCDNETGECTYTPNSNFNGEDSFSYTANDGSADSKEATVTITVNPVNDAPSFDKGADQTLNEDAGAQSVPGFASNISAGPANESGQQVTFEVTNNTNKALFSVQPSVAPNGTLTYTPAADAFGSADVSVRLKDDGGRANGGVDASAEQTFTIIVTPVNDAPRVALAEGGSCSGTGVGGTMNLTVADVDTAAGSLTPSATSSNRTLVPNANITFSGSGQKRTMTLRAAEGKSGTANITITLSDGSLKSTEIVSVKVGTNGADTITGTQGTDLLFGLGGADVLGGVGAGDLLCSGEGVDVLDGANGDDTLYGGAGRDVLRGGKGDDRLSGGGGEDELYGEEGADTMSGGSGADHFSGGSGTDTATDFTPSQGDTKDTTMETF